MPRKTDKSTDELMGDYARLLTEHNQLADAWFRNNRELKKTKQLLLAQLLDEVQRGKSV